MNQDQPAGITFRVVTNPVPQPRPSFNAATRRAFVPSGHPIHAFRDQVALEFRLAVRDLRKADEFPMSGPLLVILLFQLAPPKRGEGKVLEPGELHTLKPDIDNLTKGVLDALSGHAWRDDTQIAQLNVTKVACITEPSVLCTVVPASPLDAHVLEDDDARVE